MRLWNSIYSNHLLSGPYIYYYIGIHIIIIMCDDASAGKYGLSLSPSPSHLPPWGMSIVFFRYFLLSFRLSLLLMSNRIGCTVLYRMKIDFKLQSTAVSSHRRGQRVCVCVRIIVVWHPVIYTHSIGDSICIDVSMYRYHSMVNARCLMCNCVCAL